MNKAEKSILYVVLKEKIPKREWGTVLELF